MQTHRLCHLSAEMRLKPFVAKLLVPIINALISRIITKVMYHMADIMQQGRDDHGIALTFLLGKPGPLQGVLLLIDQGQPITATGFLLKQALDFVQEFVLHAHHFPFSK